MKIKTSFINKWK